jgi:NAD-dependent deacetylase
MPTQIETALHEELRGRLRSARRVFVLTGAGVSAESGVPTFRGGGQTAVWKGMPFDVISSARMLARDLPAVWEWFDYRRNLLRTVAPNPAHTTLARWQAKFERFTIATQNIDGLHTQAGSRDVLELHGNIWRARCTELLPAGVFERAAAEAGSSDLCFVVGTSSLVYPAMRLPEIAQACGAYTVEINPELTPFSEVCDVTIQGRAGEVLPELEF